MNERAGERRGSELVAEYRRQFAWRDWSAILNELPPLDGLTVADLGEFSFQGPADPGVLDAWRARFERMPLLRARCAADFDGVRDAFLACLQRDAHRSRSRVICCIARLPQRGPE